MTPAHDLRLVPAALAAYAAAALLLTGHGTVVVLVVAVCVALAVLAVPLRMSMSVAAAAAILVAATTAAHMQTRWSGELSLAIDRPVHIEVTALSDAIPMRSAGWDGQERFRVRATIAQWDHPDHGWVRARAHISVMGTQFGDVTVGDRLTLAGTVREIVGAWEIGVMMEPEVVAHAPPGGVDRMVAAIRQQLRDATAHLPDDTRALVRGMVVGDTAQMPQRQRHDMRVANLTHLTVVSGAHFAIVLVASAGLMTRLGWPRRVRAVTAGAVMMAFALVALPEPAVVRALGMALIGCAALWWGRPSQAMAALSVCVLAAMVTMPYLAISMGFALSVAAVSALVLWSPVLSVHLQRWMAPTLARTIAIPVAAAVACAPILVLFTDGVGVLGPLANVVAALCAVPVTLLGLLAMVVEPALPALAWALAHIAGWCAWPIAQAAQVVADLPGSWVSWPTGISGAAWMGLCALTVIVATSWRRVSALVRACGAAVVVGPVVLAVQGGALIASAPTLSDWQVVACDVGQGDMTLLRAGPTAAVVVDVGSAGAGGTACLARHGVNAIPLLILTHPHEDHDGALVEVLEAVEVSQVWVSPAAQVDGQTRALRHLEEWSVPYEAPSPTVSVHVGAVTVEVWHPPAGSIHLGINDASVVVWAHTASLSVLLPGDVEVEAQRALLRARPGGLAVDVLKVAHHGSARQHEPWIRSLSAAVAVFSVGADNRHGHPTAEALEWYGQIAQHVARTDICSDVVMTERAGQVVLTPC